MILNIAKMILIFVGLAFLVTVASVVIWIVKDIIRWIRKERGRKHG